MYSRTVVKMPPRRRRIKNRVTVPAEILLHVVELLPPTDPNIILPASHEITKTLLAFTRVCRATSSMASKYLRQHCMYIDSYKKLQALVRFLGRSAGAVDQYGEPVVYTPTQMYLSPFLDLPYNTTPAPLDDLPTAKSVTDLFTMTAPTLKRLIIDMPLRSIKPGKDYQGAKRMLRGGFEKLVNLEEFVSIKDELFLKFDPRLRREPEVWATCWPKLRRLSLYNVDMGESIAAVKLFDSLAQAKCVQSVVFPRADGLADWTTHYVSCINVKLEWLRAVFGETFPHGNRKRREDISITFLNASEKEKGFDIHQRNWEDIDPHGLVSIRLHEADEYEYEELDAIGNVQEFVRQRALAGTLFDPEMGKLIGPTPIPR